ncbi:MAG TPA: lectin like domain-containing protein [Methanoregulaceae archaeon]|nr:lectin like domain-containing protein [Methanoregulaceae archaeon]
MARGKSVISMLLICIIISGITSAVAGAPVTDRTGSGQTETAVIAPFCQEYMNWLHAHSIIYKNAQGHGLGLIPAPVDLAGSSPDTWSGSVSSEGSGATLVPGQSGTDSSGLPLSYDLRTLGRTTQVRDQGQDGNCWAFASINSLESSLLPGERDQFSENNIKNLHGFDVAPNSGGNDFMATAYFARWSGPVSESADPYIDGSSPSPSFLPVQKHVQQIFFVPARTGPLSNGQIKSIVSGYGAVYSTIRWEDTAYNSRTASYYYSGSGEPNHAIDIVGWDDSYSANNFATPAPGNGAFIAQNSWGTGWGDQGFFYISYYDTRIGRDNAMFTAEPATNYQKIYQYDPYGWVANFGLGSDTAYYANVFTSSGTETLKAVSFYTTATYADYEVKVFLDPDQGPINSEGYKVSQNGNFEMPGYHTVVLDTPVSLKAGQRFSVAIKARSPGWDFPVAIEYPIPGYSGSATASARQSYISSDGSSWQDLTSSQPNTNVCIKAFTTTSGSQVTKTVSPYPTPVFTQSGTSITTLAILKKLTGSTQVVGIPTPGIFRNLSGAYQAVSLPALPVSRSSAINITRLQTGTVGTGHNTVFSWIRATSPGGVPLV